MAGRPDALVDDERQAIVLAAQSVFTKLRNLYRAIEPTFQSYGFTAPSAGVIARDLSEKIETAIVQHCATFTKGAGFCDLARQGADWEVKICKGSGLTINQSKQIKGENYIVVNYSTETRVTAVWILWNAQDRFFSAKKGNTNARSMLKSEAAQNIETLFQASREPKKHEGTSDVLGARTADTRRPAKATLRGGRQRQAS